MLSILVDATLHACAKLMEEFKARKHAEWDPDFEIRVWCERELEMVGGAAEEGVEP